MTNTIREYDNNGNEIHYRTSDGYEWWYDYDTNGKLIHSRDSDGHEVWREYDINGKLIHSRDSNGLEVWREYDINGKLMHSRDSDGYGEWYDDNGKWIHFRDSNGYEVWREYDNNGKLIHYRDSNGYEEWREYDTNGKWIHYRNSNGFEEWYEYDTNGKLINTRNTSGATDLALATQPSVPSGERETDYLAEHHSECALRLGDNERDGIQVCDCIPATLYRAPQPSVPSGEAVRNALRRVLDNADWDDLADLANAMTGQRDVNTHEMADALLAAPPQDRVSEVTEAMVKAGVQAFDAGVPWRDVQGQVRAILTAAAALADKYNTIAKGGN
jgi:YD repeat-containing protein